MAKMCDARLMQFSNTRADLIPSPYLLCTVNASDYICHKFIVTHGNAAAYIHFVNQAIVT